MIGKTIAHYKVLEKLGAGGMGEVFLAQDIKLERRVALKFLPREYTNNPESSARFKREAKASAALNHPNIVTIYEINEYDGHAFIAMEYIDGSSLRRRLDEQELDLTKIMDITLQICEGLHHAHQLGLVHRDLKPGNIMFTASGKVKILDFGLAKFGDDSHITAHGTTIGTIAYMSPEQCQGHEVDARSDIWSVGIILFEMITRRLPFHGEYDTAFIYSILNEEPEPLARYKNGVSEEIQHMVSKALDKNRDLRYQNIIDLQADIKRALQGSRSVTSAVVQQPEPEKSSYVKDYESDVYISYANIDDKPLSAGQKGWIAKFHYDLSVRVEQLLGAESKITRVNRSADESGGTKPGVTKFSKAAIMISVVSPQYIKSEDCIREVKEFYSEAETRAGLWIEDRARIFKAVKTHVPRNLEPPELQIVPGYEFYQFDPVSGRPKEFWPELGAEAHRNYWAKLEDIAYDIYLLLEVMKSGKNQDSKIKILPNVPVVYLAETTFDLVSDHDKIKRQLQQRGCLILPDRPLPLNVELLKKQIQADLDQSNISIHLIGENYGVVPEGIDRSIVELQYDLALERSEKNSFSQMIWLAPDLYTKDDRQQNFIDTLQKGAFIHSGVDLLQTTLGDFKTFIIDKLNTKRIEPQKEEGKDEIVRIYLQCDQKDLDATNELEEYLFKQGFEIILPAFEGEEFEVFKVHQENLLSCDATLIYYGEATDSWLHTKLADLKKVAGYGRTESMLAQVVYLASPETKLKLRFRTREALIIKNFADFSPEVLQPFITAISNGKGGGK